MNYKRDTKSARPAGTYAPKGYDACQTPACALAPLRPGWRVWEAAA